MTGLPKFVRDQMGRSIAPTPHPDADVLTAFTENVLTGNERQQVMEHLSTCADCRDTVFLAQPETAQTQTVLAPKARRSTWMAWASVAAVVVVVASAVIIQHEQVTKVQPPTTVANTAPPAEPKLAETPSKRASEILPIIAETKKEARARKSDTEFASPKPASPASVGKDALADEALTVSNAPAPLAAPQTAAKQNVLVGGVPPRQTAGGPDQRNIAPQVQQAQGPSNTANINVANTNIARAEPPAAAKVAKERARADEFHGLAAGYALAPAAPPPPARARWRISGTGVLERSYVADNWAPVLPETGVKFHVVSVIGITVWAGGERGALYVSRNGGITWDHVAIDTSGTVTSIHFADDLNGTLETADAEAWKTADGGKTWQKQ